MAKLPVFSAVFAALITMAAATTYTTTVVTEINPEQSCQSEIQRARMTQCIRYVGMGMGRAYEPSFLRSEVANPRQEEEQGQAECCNELRSVSPPCRGEAVRHVIKEMKRSYGGVESIDMETQRMMSEKARERIQRCNLRPRTY